MKGMMPVHEKAAVPRRLHPMPYRGHVRLSTRWVARLTLLDITRIFQFLGAHAKVGFEKRGTREPCEWRWDRVGGWLAGCGRMYEWGTPITPSGTCGCGKRIVVKAEAAMSTRHKLKAVDRWIPVSERQPPAGVEVLITVGETDNFPSGTWGVAHRSADNRWWAFRGHLLAEVPVLAWMPLPAFYRPKGDEG